MNFKSRAFVKSLLLVFAAISGLVIADNHHSKGGTYKSVKVTENIVMLQGKGGNIAVLKGKQGLLMIDSDYSEMSDALASELGKMGELNTLTYIINTHWHSDHTQGNLALGSLAPIVAHKNVRTRLLSRQEIKLFNKVFEPYPQEAVPSITYDQSMALHFNDEHLEIVHFPNGHTDGDSVIFFKNANVVHMGDHYFSGFFPFVDVGTGGNVLKMAENVKSVLSLIDDKTKIIPGHGPLSTKADLLEYYEMLVGTSNEVNALKIKNLSLDQIKQKGLSDRWESWTNGFIPSDVWIGIVYQSLAH